MFDLCLKIHFLFKKWERKNLNYITVDFLIFNNSASQTSNNLISNLPSKITSSLHKTFIQSFYAFL